MVDSTDFSRWNIVGILAIKDTSDAQERLPLYQLPWAVDFILLSKFFVPTIQSYLAQSDLLTRLADVHIDTGTLSER